jgi:glutathione S-transferase
VDEARALVSRIDRALADAPFVSGNRYTLADTFATPALARFRVHGFDEWWSNGANGNVADYYRRTRERPSWSAAAVVDTGYEPRSVGRGLSRAEEKMPTIAGHVVR